LEHRLSSFSWLRFLHCRPGSPINRENFEKIKLGMTKKEVEEILGPAGDHSSGPLAADVSPDEIWKEWKDKPEDFAEGILNGYRKSWSSFFWRQGVTEWASDTGIIQVIWDWNGKVENTNFLDARPRLVTPLDRIRRWFLREERQVVSIPPRPVRISGGIGP
jgi:hypothetical protein